MILGEIEINNRNKIIIFKIDNEGRKLWPEGKIIYEQDDFQYFPKKIVPSGDDFIIAGATSKISPNSGSIPNLNNTRDLILSVISNSGELKKDFNLGFEGDDIVNDVILTPQNTYLLIGTTVTLGGSRIFAAIHKDTDGDQVKNSQKYGQDQDLEQGIAIRRIAGRFAILGNKRDNRSTLTFLNVSNENIILESSVSISSENLTGNNFIQSGGSIFITGSFSNLGGTADMFLLKLGNDGSKASDWPENPIKIGGASGSDAGSNLIRLKDGGFAIVGTVFFENNNTMIALIKTNEKGQLNGK
jgi:hypothetical protein